VPLDEGYFPPGSVLRMVHRERAVGLMYGQRALMIGAMHPVAFTGTILDTNGLRAPWQRLAHTGKVFETIYLGSREQADRALAFVRMLHERVGGTIPRDMGAWPGGTRYSAFDPELMLWTMAVIADSAEVTYEAFVRPLATDERERLWSEHVRFAELFGMPRDAAPPTHVEFREWWRGMLDGDRLHLTPEAREIGMQIAFEIPVPLHVRPAAPVHNLLLLGTLPPEVREAYGLGWSPVQAATFAALTAAIRRSRPITPGVVRRGASSPAFDLIARTERDRLRRGDRAMRIPAGAA
jgi:uncharacterized protein (DUF2236 family)